MDLLRDISQWVWARHFDIPRGLYWLGYVIGVLMLAARGYVSSPLVGYCALALAVLSVSGLIRWAASSSPPPLLVIPLFACPTNPARGREVQSLIVTSLQDHFGPRIRFGIRSIPVGIGRDQAQKAQRILKRLGAFHLIYGDIRDLGVDTFSVYARLLIGLDPPVTHLDPHTKEQIPIRGSWSALIDRLSPAQRVEDVEYPLEFANEIEAIIRSLEGELYSFARRDDLAVKTLQAALSLAKDSESSAIDRVRVLLAWSHYHLGERQEAVDLLRNHASKHQVSAHLLRNLAALLVQVADPDDPFEKPILDMSYARQLAFELLERAEKDRTDPLRDQTRYNLAQFKPTDIQGTESTVEILTALLNSRSHYRRVWYVRRDLAAAHWRLFTEFKQLGELERAATEVALSAHWYSRAIRRRRRWTIWRDRLVIRFKRFHVPPILYANAHDAHREADHRIRARYHAWRMHRVRVRLLDRAVASLMLNDWPSAYVDFDRAETGRLGDVAEMYSLVGRAITLGRMGADAAAEGCWNEAVSINEQSARSIRHLLQEGAGLAQSP